MTTAPDPDIDHADLGRFEPSPYDLGITDDPEAAYELAAEGEPPALKMMLLPVYPAPVPVPYSLTPAAEAALDDPEARGPYPGSGDPERLARWCGFPAMAAMEAACEADAREQAAQSAMEARWEA